MLDYAVMWIHSRLGKNTAVSYPLWAWVLGGLFLFAPIAAILSNISETGTVVIAWLVIVWFVVAVVRGIKKMSDHRNYHAANPVESCSQCTATAIKLERLETREAQAANMARLSRKYRA